MPDSRVFRFVAVVVALALLSGTGATFAQQSTTPPDPETLEQMYDGGIGFDVFLANAVRRKQLWDSNWAESAPAADFVARANALQGRYRILAVTIDSCSDSANTIPYIARLVSRVDRLELQIVDPDVGRLLMGAYRTPDGRGATPTVIILDESFEVVGTFIERPTPLQDWWVGHPEISDREKARRKQGWYDWDEGYSTYAEIVGLLEAADAAGDGRAAMGPRAAEELTPYVATFSILGYDPDTGMVGSAVQSRVFSVGNGVLWGEANVGMVATQAIVDVSYGPQALELLGLGMAPAAIVETIRDNDPDPGYRGNAWPKTGRQFSVMNAAGEVATFTGAETSDWAGHVVGEHSSAQGNILAGPTVVQDMVTAFEDTEGHLSLRLMAALEAGQAAGGDRRGMQSAAMLIVQEDGGVWLNNDVVLRLQVDDSEDPIVELRRLVDLANRRFGGRRR